MKGMASLRCISLTLCLFFLVHRGADSSTTKRKTTTGGRPQYIKLDRLEQKNTDAIQWEGFGRRKYPLVNRKVLYSGLVTFGTPPQEVYVQFDTGSADLWCFSTKTHGLSDCSVYDRAKSSSYSPQGGKDSTQLKYGGGSVHVQPVKETVRLLNKTLPSDKLEVGIADNDVDNNLKETCGILGLAYPTEAVITSSMAPIRGLCQSLSIPVLFTFYITDHSKDQSYFIVGSETSGNELTNTMWVPVKKNSGRYTSYSVNVFHAERSECTSKDGKQISSKDFCDNNCEGLVDTGTTLLLLPSDMLADVQEAVCSVGPCCDDATEGPYLDLPDFPNITFTMSVDGEHKLVDLTLPGSAYLEYDKKGSCYNFLTQPSDGIGFDFILGDVWLRYFQSSFDMDNHRIGFAGVQQGATFAASSHDYPKTSWYKKTWIWILVVGIVLVVFIIATNVRSYMKQRSSGGRSLEDSEFRYFYADT